MAGDTGQAVQNAVRLADGEPPDDCINIGAELYAVRGEAGRYWMLAGGPAMSSELCLNCGEMAPADIDRCPSCGAAVARSRPAGDGRGALPPLAPIVFVVAGLAIGIAGTLAVNLALGIPAGLLGGGIGVWMLVRSRRLR